MMAMTNPVTQGARAAAPAACRALSRALAFVLITIVPTAVFAQPLPGTPGPVAPVTGGTSVAQVAPTTVLAQAAQSVGVRRCYSAINLVSSRVFSDAQHEDVVLDWDHKSPDTAPFFSLSGMEYQSGAAVFSLTTVPALMGGCAILAERISSAPLSCKDVARSELAGYHGTPLVKAVTVYTAPGRPRETVTLVDAPPSCVIVRRQVQFEWGAAQ